MNDVFTPEQKQALLRDLAKWWGEADRWAHFNQAWDLGFKILLLLLAVTSAIAAATIATRYRESAAPSWLSIFNTSASAIVAVFSAFAFSQIDFANRERTYETKRNEFGGIIDELNYFTPKKRRYLTNCGLFILGATPTLHRQAVFRSRISSDGEWRRI